LTELFGNFACLLVGFVYNYLETKAPKQFGDRIIRRLVCSKKNYTEIMVNVSQSFLWPLIRDPRGLVYQFADRLKFIFSQSC
jgi:hypothetical protein